MCVCVCVRACEWERKRDRVTSQHVSYLNGGLCVCVCERERERERETGSHHSGAYSPSEIVLIAACSQIHTSFINRVCHATLFLSRASTDAKTKDIINCLYFNFESWSSWLWKGALHFRHGLWCSANHNALCQLANQSTLCLSEGGTL